MSDNCFANVVTHGQTVRDAFYLQLSWSWRMNTRELDFSLNLDLTCLSGATNEYRCTTPLYGSRIGIDAGIANDFAFALNGKADVFLR